MFRTKVIEVQKDKGLHPRNPHRGRYNFEELMEVCKDLKKYVKINKSEELGIDFAVPGAVLALNKALLHSFYKIENWTIPKDSLCPPIPGRADYIHYISDILAKCNGGTIPVGKQVKVLDIGTGANCIYPIIGNSVYGWKFVGTDSESESVNNAKSILKANGNLAKNVKCRLQSSKSNIFNGIIKQDEKFDFTMCNPPFHSSLEEAQFATKTKLKNLSVDKKKKEKLVHNFGGQSTELWCEGGELSFIKQMIQESKTHAQSCYWFSTLVSKKENVELVEKELKKARVLEYNVVEMQQGNKLTRFFYWTHLTKKQQKEWKAEKWK